MAVTEIDSVLMKQIVVLVNQPDVALYGLGQDVLVYWYDDCENGWRRLPKRVVEGYA